MDGIHDLGGKQGFGPVEIDDLPVGFHERWHAAVFTMVSAAFASGAQVISTDYYLENPYFGTGYRVSPPAGGVACNPVRQADGCRLPF